MTPKTVAIIGAGPSGLVAAKTLLRSKTNEYKVTVFDSKPELGGLWAVHPDRPYAGMLNPQMPTNLSRFNIGFSDLAWQSIGLEGHLPYWPRAWQAGQYLRTYAQRFVPKDCLRLSTRVKSVSAVGRNGEISRWRVQWLHVDESDPDKEHMEEEIFDRLIVATGYFAGSSIPQFETGEIPTAHTTKLRKLQDVVPLGDNIEGTVLIVGGGMSGADTATVLAAELSDSLHSPDKDNKKYSRLKLVQLSPESAYALPLASPCDKDEPAAPHFLPLDLCFYRLDFKPSGPIRQSIDKQSLEVTRSLNDTFQGLVGNQSDLNAPGLLQSDSSKAPYALLTEQYSNFVRSGTIRNLAGRLKSLTPSSSSVKSKYPSLQATYAVGEQTSTIDDVIGIVWATGYTPQPSLSFLSPDLLQKLDHDPSHNRLPILLEDHATLHSKIPGLAMIGFHEGAFWGSMEMEARLVERTWSTPAPVVKTQRPADCSPNDEKSTEDEKATNILELLREQRSSTPSKDKCTLGDQEPATDILDHLRSMRLAMTSKDKSVPQYWMGDYVGLMDELSRLTNCTRNDLTFSPPQSGPITPARYTDSTCDLSETTKILEEFSSVLERSRTEALFTGRAAFLGLQGDWKIERTIISHLPTMPSGTLVGRASFHPRYPADSSPTHDQSSAYLYEYLYTESGTFNMSNGLSMTASRRYVYRYNESTDKITVWFVKEDGLTVDYLYHGLEIDVAERSKEGWLARADHLCVEDMYDSSYRFRFEGANLGGLTVRHEVKGPRKDYISTTRYER